MIQLCRQLQGPVTEHLGQAVPLLRPCRGCMHPTWISIQATACLNNDNLPTESTRRIFSHKTHTPIPATHTTFNRHLHAVRRTYHRAISSTRTHLPTSHSTPFMSAVRIRATALNTTCILVFTPRLITPSNTQGTNCILALHPQSTRKRHRSTMGTHRRQQHTPTSSSLAHPNV